jgi:hypothetical protein
MKCVRQLLFSLILASLAAKGKCATEIPWPDIVVIGEEHGNSEYRNIILESLPDFVDAGFEFFASENSSDLQPKVDQYIDAVVKFESEAKTKALWEIGAAMVGRTLPTNTTAFRKVQIPGGDRLESTLQPLVDARIAGLKVVLVDLDTQKLLGYMRHENARGEGRDQAIAGLYSTLGARNKHMAQMIQPKTILLVGRAHTGREDGTVEQYIRKRGLSCISIDLFGKDNGSYPDSSKSADHSATPDQIKREGGLANYLKSRLPLPRANTATNASSVNAGTPGGKDALP